MKKLVIAIFLLAIVYGCGDLSSEMKGTAKPEGGIQDVIPATKSYNIEHAKLWKAVQEVLEDQGYIFSADNVTGHIKTDPKILGDPNKVKFMGSTY